MTNDIAKILGIALFAVLSTSAHAQATVCSEFGGKTFCTAGPKKPLRVFGECLTARVKAAQRGEGEKLVPNWLEPASTAAACMANQGVAEAPTPRPSGGEICQDIRDTSVPDTLRFCKAGAKRDAWEVSTAYCRQTAMAFFELEMLPTPSRSLGNGFDAINLQLIAPCLVAQGWSVKKAPAPKANPKQRPGEMDSI